jgi:acyl homoserine lactone synthase
MLCFLTAAALKTRPRLCGSLYSDRARQFRDRLGWPVTVDAAGWETDEYDACDPLYVVWVRPDGLHGGSMRFLPTIGRTMAAEHFLALSGGVPVSDAGTWECTRFCLAEDAPPLTAARLMLGGAEVGAHFGLARALGVFDARMVRVYRALGWSPEVIGTTGQGAEAISLGLWTFGEAVRRRVALRAGIAPDLSRHWTRMALGEVAAAA